MKKLKQEEGDGGQSLYARWRWEKSRFTALEPRVLAYIFVFFKGPDRAFSDICKAFRRAMRIVPSQGGVNHAAAHPLFRLCLPFPAEAQQVRIEANSYLGEESAPRSNKGRRSRTIPCLADKSHSWLSPSVT